MADAHPAALSLAHLRLGVFPHGKLPSGPTLGRHLRGALGLWLRRQCCPTPQAAAGVACSITAPCTHCLAYVARAASDRHPPHPTADGPRPLWVNLCPDPEVAVWHERRGGTPPVVFEVSCLGPLLPHLDDLVAALLPAQETGLGHPSYTFRLGCAALLTCSGRVVWEAPHLDVVRSRVPPADPADFDFHAPAHVRVGTMVDVRVDFLTPTAVSHGGLVQRVPGLNAVVDAVGRRLRELALRWGDSEAAMNWPVLAGDHIAEWSGGLAGDHRRSRSQGGTRHDLSGFVGQVLYTNVPVEVLSWLHLAEQLHVGANIPFGCGQLRFHWR